MPLLTVLAKAVPAKLRRWLISAVLAGLAMLAVNLLRRLPYSAVRVQVSDAMTVPGGVLAELYVMAFGETKNWLVTWAWLAIIGNVLFYVVLWYVLISVYEWFRGRRGASRGVT